MKKIKNNKCGFTLVDAGIRYVGSNPNNKVYFNCEDEYTNDDKTIKYGDVDYVYKDHCEVWRIIGVFNTKSSESETEEPLPRIKIVRDAFSINMRKVCKEGYYPNYK